jgi:hypothetical protein
MTLPGHSHALPWWFWLNPLRALLVRGPDTLFSGAPLAMNWLLPAMILVVVVDWLLVAFAFRRERNAGSSLDLAALTVVPILQVGVILWLCVAPPKRAEPAQSLPEIQPPARTAVLGLLSAAALGVAAVAFSTLILGAYGYGLFIAAPVAIAMTTGYIANRRGDIGSAATMKSVFGGLLLGGLALVGFAFEGLICLVLASPLIAVMAVIGGLLGRGMAIIGRRPRATAMSVAFVPILMMGETILPPHASFESAESVDVAASPAAVWDSIVHMGPIPGAPAIPFRWGLAYPMRGEIIGSGVGAVRRGVFSTGVAYERVTAWEPGHKLTFIVLSDPPSMHELSPYAHVNAPHVNGYFRTLDARFTITPLADGKTRLTLATHHDLDLEPALYWLPLAEWATHANKVRVLEHFRRQAEAAAPIAGS